MGGISDLRDTSGAEGDIYQIGKKPRPTCAWASIPFKAVKVRRGVIHMNTHPDPHRLTDTHFIPTGARSDLGFSSLTAISLITADSGVNLTAGSIEGVVCLLSDALS